MLASILLALLSFTLSLPLLVCLTIENQDQTIEDQDQPIFLSIDCGIPKDGNYTDGMTTIDYVSDASFIDSGVGTTHNISATFKTDSLAQQYFILRSFPDGTKNCYKLPTGETGAESIIRASFMYGNYDGLNKLPQFEIQLGVETWDTVQFADANSSVRKEIIFSPVSNITYLCLVNTGLGTPFISAIEIRSSMVRGYGTSSLAALSLFQRWNFGDITVNNIIRYPDDKLDRIWSALALPPGTEILNNTLVVPYYLVGGPITNPPVSVLKTAVTPLNLTDPIRYSWEISNPTSQLQIYSYFSELLYLQPNQTREMDVLVNGISNNPFTTAVWPQTTSVLSRTPGNADSVDFRVARTSKSTLPPLLNAMEIYILRQFSHLPTAQNEVDAMNNIKTSLPGKKLDWQGDPCLPQGYAWSGLTCGYNGTQSPQITSLNLSATGLTGGNQSYTYMGELKSLQILDLSNNSLNGIIPEFLAELLALELLDLSNNSLDGTIPNFLAQLPSLKFLSLKGNKFTGLVPDELMRRSANGSITLRVDDNNCPSCNRKNNKSGSMVIPAVAASIGGSLLITLLIFSIWSVIKKPRADKRVRGLFEGIENEDDLELPLFSLTTIVEATDNFSVEKKLGQGGFGSVYKGVIGDEKEIAVKRLSISSSQGQDEFKNEAILIAKLQHRNLVKLIGCCLEGVEKMLVYEYMPNKSLDYFIFDQIQGKLIDWPRRFWIIHGIARGLLYLHQDSRLTIIHRDLKASNILLDSKMNPKISDFGMAKTFGGEQIEGNTTRVAGTYGYMAPEYASDGLFSMKSDVFSFGVLLLEIVSGKKNRALYRGKQSSVNLVGYAWTLWSDGRAMELLDVVLADSCSLAEVVRCIHIGLLCVEQHPEDRPTMSSIVQMLDNDKELPQPKHPAFFSNRDRPEASITTAADNTESFSINEASLSDLRGR